MWRAILNKLKEEQLPPLYLIIHISDKICVSFVVGLTQMGCDIEK